MLKWLKAIFAIEKPPDLCDCYGDWSRIFEWEPLLDHIRMVQLDYLQPHDIGHEHYLHCDQCGKSVKFDQGNNNHLEWYKQGLNQKIREHEFREKAVEEYRNLRIDQMLRQFEASNSQKIQTIMTTNPADQTAPKDPTTNYLIEEEL